MKKPHRMLIVMLVAALLGATVPSLVGHATAGPLTGTITVAMHESYAAPGVTSSSTCSATLSLSGDGATHAEVRYAHDEQYTEQRGENVRTVTAVHEEPSQGGSFSNITTPRISIDPSKGTYTVSYQLPGLPLKKTTTTQTTGEQPRVDVSFVSGSPCPGAISGFVDAYPAGHVYLTGKLPGSAHLHGTVQAHGDFDRSGGIGSATVNWSLTDPTLAGGQGGGTGTGATATPLQGRVANNTPTGIPTQTGGRGSGTGPGATATPSAPQPRSCPIEVAPGISPSGVPPESYAEAAKGPVSAPPPGRKATKGPTIVWHVPHQLTWSAYHKVPPVPGTASTADITTVAVTNSGPGTAVGYLPYRGICDPKTNTFTTQVTYTTGNEHALFYPDESWVLPEYRLHPSTAASVGILNHEQRHFDVSEVYSRKAHAELLALLGGRFVQTFACRQWGDCEKQATALYQQLDTIKNTIVSQWEAAQKQYDLAAGLTSQTKGQAEWNLMIDGWLKHPDTAP